MKKIRIVLSLFDGMSTLQQAMLESDISFDKYYASEIKTHALKQTRANFPGTIMLGDVMKWKRWNIDWSKVDFIGSGSPCQDLSRSGKRAGINGERSSLFFVFVDILEHVRKVNPGVLFLQENVGSAPSLDVGIMSRALGVYPERINSSLVVGALRDRLYWTNIRTKQDGFFGEIISDIPQPRDRKILFQDIITDDGVVDRRKCGCLLENEYKNLYKDMDKFREQIDFRNSVGKNPPIHVRMKDGSVRNLTKAEFCRIQGFPDDFCSDVLIRQAVSLLGDGWTLPIIVHILNLMKDD